MQLTHSILFASFLITYSTATSFSGSIAACDEGTSPLGPPSPITNLTPNTHSKHQRPRTHHPLQPPSNKPAFHPPPQPPPPILPSPPKPLVNNTRPTTAPLTTLGGRIYLANATIGRRPFTLVIDTSSSDTWVATTSFRCLDTNTYAVLPQATCRFGPLYNRTASPSFKAIPYNSQVDYGGGEFLYGEMGTERVGIGEGRKLEVE